MDYMKQNTMFKIKKVLRYARLYGVMRTLAKVRGQRHMRKCYKILPASTPNFNPVRFAAIIGCGNFAYTTIAYFLKKRLGNVLGACMDIDLHRAASLAQTYDIPFYTSNADQILADDRIRLVYISSYHSSHAGYAIRALQAGKHVYIEKPHVVTEEQLSQLVFTMKNTSGKVFIGFNRPFSRFGREIARYLQCEGGPGMYNWFVGGHDLEPDHWYHRPGEGGRVLGNMCHWTDFVLRLVPPDKAHPILINPTRCHETDVNVAVNYTFGDRSMATITFAAKGHAFEGVRERFTGYRGNCLITIDDFERMTVDVIDRKTKLQNLYRDYGHETSIIEAARSVMNDYPYDRDSERAYIWNTGLLVLRTKQALQQNTKITVSAFDESLVNEKVRIYETTAAV